MGTPKYTRADMKQLAAMSHEDSIPSVQLPDLGYDPKKFRALLEQWGLTKDIHYLFELPIEEVPLLINKGEVSGYLQFRFTVGK